MPIPRTPMDYSAMAEAIKRMGPAFATFGEHVRKSAESMNRLRPVEIAPGVTLYPPGAPLYIPYRGKLHTFKDVTPRRK